MNYLQRVYHALLALLFYGMFSIAVGLCILRLLAFSPYMVLTGSMQPQYPIGSLVYVRAVAQERLQVGDAITFAAPNGETVITHAIVAIDTEDGLYYTKGIANDAWDASAVPYENIIGKVYFCIPYLGYLTVPLASKNGRLAVIFATLAIWAMVYLVRQSFAKRIRPKPNNKTTR